MTKTASRMFLFPCGVSTASDSFSQTSTPRMIATSFLPREPSRVSQPFPGSRKYMRICIDAEACFFFGVSSSKSLSLNNLIDVVSLLGKSLLGLKNSFYGGIPLGILGYISNETFQLLRGGGEHHKLHVKLPQEDNRSVMTTGVLRDEKLPICGGKNH